MVEDSVYKLVATSKAGDLHETCVAALFEVPLVTWQPSGPLEETFCLVATNIINDDIPNADASFRPCPIRLVWLVVDIPGTDDSGCEDDHRLSRFGFAGNGEAVELGKEVVPYEAFPSGFDPVKVHGFRIALLKQRVRSLQLKDVPDRGGFDLDAFISEHQLEVLVEKKVNVANAASDAIPDVQVSPQRLAFSSGEGPLRLRADSPLTLTAALEATATGVGKAKGLTIYDASGVRQRLTYKEIGAAAPSSTSFSLLQASDTNRTNRFGSRLRRPFGMRRAQMDYSDAGHAVCNKLCNVWTLLEQPPIITTVANVGKLKQLNLMELICVISREELSSGSTGIPKCIQIAHRGVVAHIQGEAQFCGYDSSDVHVNFLPLDHVVPILTVHCCDVYHGCEEIQAEVAYVLSDVLRWLQLVDEHRATRTWAPNFAFKLVAEALRQEKEKPKFDLSCCKFWMNAGEQVTVPVCEAFLEETEMYGVSRSSLQPSFGMAEACTCMTYNNQFEVAAASRLGRSAFVNLGPPVPGIEIRIANEDGETLAEEEVGRFQIRGPVITPGYLKNEEANKEAFVEDDWFNTGDIGFLRAGQLYLTGREKEMIIIRGANFYCYEVEDVVNSMDSVTATFTAAVSLHDPTSGTEGEEHDHLVFICNRYQVGGHRYQDIHTILSLSF
ncbi:Polyketide synthase PksJ (PKS) [Durusdinium trenchii]|uniref:Polyketide synthase PksJ (PKS) n=1 Tax=Durusdinium trenchii TaxID=1381693 RepID=A0ABP0IQ91_9DINO